MKGSHKSQCKILNGQKKTITCTVEYDAIGKADLAAEKLKKIKEAAAAAAAIKDILAKKKKKK